MSHLKRILGGLCGLLVVYALWTLYLVHPNWRAALSLTTPAFWVMVVFGFWLGFYLAGREG